MGALAGDLSGQGWLDGCVLAFAGDWGTSDWALRNRLGITSGFVGDDWGRLRRTARASTRAGLLLYRPRVRSAWTMGVEREALPTIRRMRREGATLRAIADALDARHCPRAAALGCA